jgi:hypothetical protein
MSLFLRSLFPRGMAERDPRGRQRGIFRARVLPPSTAFQQTPWSSLVQGPRPTAAFDFFFCDESGIRLSARVIIEAQMEARRGRIQILCRWDSSAPPASYDKKINIVV